MRESHDSLQRGTRTGSPSVVTLHAEEMTTTVALSSGDDGEVVVAQATTALPARGHRGCRWLGAVAGPGCQGGER
jgi:hypothetical protein